MLYDESSLRRLVQSAQVKHHEKWRYIQNYRLITELSLKTQQESSSLVKSIYQSELCTLMLSWALLNAHTHPAPAGPSTMRMYDLTSHPSLRSCYTRNFERRLHFPFSLPPQQAHLRPVIREVIVYSHSICFSATNCLLCNIILLAQ